MLRNVCMIQIDEKILQLNRWFALIWSIFVENAWRPAGCAGVPSAGSEAQLLRAQATWDGGARSVKIRSLEAAKTMKNKWLVLGCIEADFCNQILIFQHFSRSTRFPILRTAQISKFQQIFEKILRKCWNFWKIWKIRSWEECGICSSRQELSNEYLVAKIGFDTAENEPLKVRITDHTFDHIPSVL